MVMLPTKCFIHAAIWYPLWNQHFTATQVMPWSKVWNLCGLTWTQTGANEDHRHHHRHHCRHCNRHHLHCLHQSYHSHHLYQIQCHSLCSPILSFDTWENAKQSGQFGQDRYQIEQLSNACDVFFAKYFLGGFMLLSFISKSTENDLKRDGEKEWQIVHIWAPLARRYIYAFNLWERLFACKWNFPSLDGILYPLWLCLIELHNKEDRNHHDIITVNEIITIAILIFIFIILWSLSEGNRG